MHRSAFLATILQPKVGNLRIVVRPTVKELRVMIKRIQFSMSYALHNILRDRQRTAFALFSIAAGVATVVALRMLVIMLTDALTSNAQALMLGDLTFPALTMHPPISIPHISQ